MGFRDAKKPQEDFPHKTLSVLCYYNAFYEALDVKIGCYFKLERGREEVKGIVKWGKVL